MKVPRLAVVFFALGVCLVPVTSAQALSAPKAVTLSLPAPNAGLNQGYLPFQSCSSLGNCAITGIYLGAKGYATGVIDYEVKGTWMPPLRVTPPQGYAAAKGVTMEGISCPSTANCVALGQYTTQSNQLPFTLSEVAGVWHTGARLALPTGAMATNESATARSLACVSSGNCTVVGTYTTNTTTFATQGFMESEIHGVWRRPVTLTLPAGTNANPFVTLSQVACWSPTDCAATGSYIDANNVSHAVVVPEVNGAWKTALAIGLPGNASAFAGAQFNEITCVGTGACLAAGTYNTLTGAVQPLVALSVAGVWNRALEVTLPNAAANPQALLYGFKGVACATPGNCTLGGQYVDKSGHYQGFLANVVNGALRRAQTLALPSGAVQAGHNGGVVSISCPALNACVAGAAYLSAANTYSALLVSEVNGVWSRDDTISLPGTATTVGVAGGVYSVQCFSNVKCQVSGSFQSGTNRYDGFSLLTTP